MSLHGYKYAIDLMKADPPFYGLIMAAMLKADDINEERMRRTWPMVWEELHARYHAPGGRLQGEEDTVIALPETE